jgi:hypothetical protein
VLGSLGGILLMEYLRATLLKREIGWELFESAPPSDPLKDYYHLQPHLSSNLNDIYNSIIYPHADLLPLPLVLALALAVVLVVRHGMKAAPLAIYAVAQVAALLLFAIIKETRTLLTLVPFLCLGGMLAAKPNWDTN